MTKPDIIRIAQAIFTVKDLNASREFYVDLLGMNILHEQSDALYLRGVEDREWTLKLEQCREGEPPRVRHLGYRVRDEQALDGLLAVLVEVVRGTPFLVQLFVLYYGAPMLGLRLDALPAGLLGLTRSMAGQLGPLGIRVNAVCPGFIETPMLADALAVPEVKSAFVAAAALASSWNWAWLMPASLMMMLRAEVIMVF